MPIPLIKKLELYSSVYKELKKTAAADYAAGDFVTLEETHGFPLVAVKTGELFTLVTSGEKVRAEKTAAIINAGDAVYWVNATSNVAIAGDILIGRAGEDAAAPDTHIIIEFDGLAAFLKA